MPRSPSKLAGEMIDACLRYLDGQEDPPDHYVDVEQALNLTRVELYRRLVGHEDRDPTTA